MLVVFGWSALYAQRSSNGKSSYTRSRYNANAPKARGVKSKLICPEFDKNLYPYHGLGVKLGDPFAITYKFYPTKKLGFVIDFGKTSSGLYNRYFRQKFDSYIVQDTLSPGAEFSYTTHKVKSDLVGEVKMLYHASAREISPGMQAYIGLGWQWKNTRIEYGYSYNTIASTGEHTYGKFKRNRLTMGPEIVAGIEYAYSQIPLAGFIELEYFTDIQADPGWHRFEGGVGLRYIF